MIIICIVCEICIFCHFSAKSPDFNSGQDNDQTGQRPNVSHNQSRYNLSSVEDVEIYWQTAEEPSHPHYAPRNSSVVQGSRWRCTIFLSDITALNDLVVSLIATICYTVAVRTTGRDTSVNKWMNKQIEK